MRYALVALILVGCSEKKEQPAEFVCSSRVECPNQRAPASLDECNDAAFDPNCGATYRTFFECLSRNQVCDGRGLLDPDASAARCGEQLDAWSQCAAPVDSAVPIDTSIEDTFVAPDTTEPDTTIDDTATAD
jgi:hypothetical protein